MARRLGANESELAALAAGTLEAFPPATRAALRFAERMTSNPRGVDNALFDELAAHWTASQIVELTAVAALFNYFNRFAEALGIPVTR